MSPTSYKRSFYHLNVIHPQSYWEQEAIYTASQRTYNIEICCLYQWSPTTATYTSFSQICDTRKWVIILYLFIVYTRRKLVHPHFTAPMPSEEGHDLCHSCENKQEWLWSQRRQQNTTNLMKNKNQVFIVQKLGSLHCCELTSVLTLWPTLGNYTYVCTRLPTDFRFLKP